MNISLDQILTLVGKLDDGPGDGTARNRFRQFLDSNVKDVGEVRDYIEQCLRSSGDQYCRALQDLVNHLGRFLGFGVTFGRYQGTHGEIGYDGLWVSHTGLHIVVEVKTTEAYSIDTSIPVGYVDALISQKRIPDWDHALGLYVVGRKDSKRRHLESAIIGEKRTAQLRVVSCDSLLLLAEIMSQYDVTHEDILGILRPTSPSVDPLIQFVGAVVAQTTAGGPPETESADEPVSAEGTFWLTPLKDHEGETALECVQNLVGKHSIFAFSENAPGRKHMKPGDMICFYAAATGVVGHAELASAPERKIDERVLFAEDYPWVCDLAKPLLNLDQPVVIDPDLRSRLEAFEGRDPSGAWSWFVQCTHRLSEHDFKALTREAGEGQ